MPPMGMWQWLSQSPVESSSDQKVEKSEQREEKAPLQTNTQHHLVPTNPPPPRQQQHQWCQPPIQLQLLIVCLCPPSAPYAHGSALCASDAPPGAAEAVPFVVHLECEPGKVATLGVAFGLISSQFVPEGMVNHTGMSHPHS
ncbi:unnamed protein product, partial [Closterium sp. Naga37s-1]